MSFMEENDAVNIDRGIAKAEVEAKPKKRKNRTRHRLAKGSGYIDLVDDKVFEPSIYRMRTERSPIGLIFLTNSLCLLPDVYFGYAVNFYGGVVCKNQ